MCLTIRPPDAARRDTINPAAVLTRFKVLRNDATSDPAGPWVTVYRCAPWSIAGVNVARGRVRAVPRRHSPGVVDLHGGALHFYDTARGAKSDAPPGRPSRRVVRVYVVGADVTAVGTFSGYHSTAARRCYPTKADALAAIKRRKIGPAFA